MDTSFRLAAAQYKQVLPALSHGARVVRLYRRALKTQYSWAVDRQVFIGEAEKLRAAFDKHAALEPSSAKAMALLKAGEAKLVDYTHPDKYICAYMPGGGATEGVRNPDMTLVVEGEKGTAGAVLIDQHSKSMS
ncbi:NADH dehydrogenase ubiquinone 1 beta [Aureococcus anophagefferens]|uniref:NADH dehydrogenase [ubiquinone] 1 beta subcomplex subunit 9 n=1 Tax=Aureococcus anophagefferens TaxID=44056 RepID=A0ABR1G6N7_AURAN